MKNNSYHNLAGEQKEQILITVDQSGHPQGFATREECHRGSGKTHLAFMALLFDKDGKVILTKRSKKKSLWANVWDASVVSHILPGETPEEAARRRGREELGIDTKFRGIGAFYYFAKYKENAENEYCYVLSGKAERHIFPNPVEIDEIKKISLSELKEKIQKNPHKYTPWLKLALDRFTSKIR